MGPNGLYVACHAGKNARSIRAALGGAAGEARRVRKGSLLTLDDVGVTKKQVRRVR